MNIFLLAIVFDLVYSEYTYVSSHVHGVINANRYSTWNTNDIPPPSKRKFEAPKLHSLIY